MNLNGPNKPLLTLTMGLSLEERCALVDIAQAGRVDVVHTSFKDALLLKLATGAAKALYSGTVPASESAIHQLGPNDIAPLDMPLMITFTPTMPMHCAQAHLCSTTYKLVCD